MVDFGKVLMSSANELQQISNASSREDYIPQILTDLLKIPPRETSPAAKSEGKTAVFAG